MNNFSDQQNSPAADNKGWLSRERALVLVLIAATMIAFYVCYLIALPFIPAIIWAMALAVIAYPLHDWILRRINSPNIAAAIVILVIAVVIIGPGIFLGQTLINQVGKGAEALKTQAGPEQWKNTVESNPKLASVINWIDPYLDVRDIAERAANTAASQISTFVGGLIWIVAQMVITFFTLFYFLRDKRSIIKTIKSFVPLSQSEIDKMFSRLGNTIYATVYGTLAVSLVQGILGGLMFWLLGIPAPVLWGAVMFLLSLVPVLGAPVVWIPASIYLALTGDWGKALILAGWGLIVIGSVDNLLYPILVGDKLRLHPLLIFFSVIGGLALIGAAGLVLGPVAVVITSMLVEVWRQRTSDGNTAEDGVYNAPR